MLIGDQSDHQTHRSFKDKDELHNIEEERDIVDESMISQNISSIYKNSPHLTVPKKASSSMI